MEFYWFQVKANKKKKIDNFEDEALMSKSAHI